MSLDWVIHLIEITLLRAMLPLGGAGRLRGQKENEMALAPGLRGGYGQSSPEIRHAGKSFLPARHARSGA